MNQTVRFFLYWLILNIIGFNLGSLHGSTNNGFIPLAIGGYPGLILGDLVFGALIGLAQYIAIRKTDFISVSLWWVAATSLGFTIGARMGSLLTFQITDDWVVAGIVFGVFMGGSIGLTTGFTLFISITPKPLLIWVSTTVTSWIAGESIAFASHFSHDTVPFVALPIACVTGWGLVCLRHRIPTPEGHKPIPQSQTQHAPD